MYMKMCLKMNLNVIFTVKLPKLKFPFACILNYVFHNVFTVQNEK